MAKGVLIVVLAILVAICFSSCNAADSEEKVKPVKILNHNQIQDEKMYKVEFESSDGQKRTESAVNRPKEDGGLIIRGMYEYVIGSKKYTVTYEAGQGGFKPRMVITDV